MLRHLPLIALFAAAACSGGSDDKDTPSDTDTDTDTASTGDTFDTGDLPRLARVGTGVATTDYVGTESEVWRTPSTDTVVCEIAYDLTSTAVRGDCANCDWAFDLVTSNTTVVVDDGGACMDIVGVDAKTASTLDGRVRSYGYDPVYQGHAEILMFDEGSGWAPGTYVSWDDKTSTITYDWEI